jgi:GntR family transcriptional regulator
MSQFIIQTNSNVPIYRQLVELVQRLAASGQLTPGEQLPSVRQLAKELAINPMTISKAYSQLEQDGLLERRRGVGMVLRKNTTSTDDLIEPVIKELILQSRQLGMSKSDLLEKIATYWSEKK